MKHYYVNKKAQVNGDHEVHVEGCKYMPSLENRIYLGTHSSCQSAVKEASKYFKQVNGCYTCCNPCHTS